MATPNDVPGLHRMNPAAAYNRGKQDGQKEARQLARAEVLSILESKYMDESIERDSPVAKAILTIAKEVAEEYRALGV